MADELNHRAEKGISQKALAKYLDLSPSTVSVVMNNAPRARLIPEATRKRILEAAAHFDYRPNFYAQYLYTKRSYTAAVLVADLREAYASATLTGIDRQLTGGEYLYFTAHHYGSAELIRELPRRLIQRAVEGFLLVNTSPQGDLGRPAVMIGSAPKVQGIPRFGLNNYRGGVQAMEYLAALGHKKVAIIKGHPWRAASEPRAQGAIDCARQHGIVIDERLIRQLQSHNTPSEPSMPEEGFSVTTDLLAAKAYFTALICFNDATSIGAIRALRSAGLRVPQDISVIGFDDIESAAYLSPSLTTLRQPFEQMGELAAKHLIDIINGGQEPLSEELVEAHLIIRESTAEAHPAAKKPASRKLASIAATQH